MDDLFETVGRSPDTIVNASEGMPVNPLPVADQFMALLRSQALGTALSVCRRGMLTCGLDGRRVPGRIAPMVECYGEHLGGSLEDG